MEAKDALVIEILARVSKGEGYQRLAASASLVEDVRRRYTEAEQTLQETVSIGCMVNDSENYGNWQLIYHNNELFLNPFGAVGFTHWDRIPPAVLLEALPLVSRLVSLAQETQNAHQSTLLQTSARFNSQDPGDELPTLKGTELPPPEPEPDVPGVSDPNAGFEGPETEAEDIMAALSATDEEATTPESVLADEILAGIDTKVLAYEAPLPELKNVPSLPKAPKKTDSLPDVPAVKVAAAKKSSRSKR